jgi:IS5 family transposase
MTFVTRVQKSFSEPAYTGKKKQTRRERVLGDLEELMPWAEVGAEVAGCSGVTTGLPKFMEGAG